MKSDQISISRELAERLDSQHSPVRNAALESLRRIIAAPVVERQEPVFVKPQYLTVKGLWIECDESDPKAVAFFTSPPAPVAVVLPERLPEPNWDDFKPMSQEYEAACEGVSKWNGCIDKVEEMNR